VLGFLLNQTIAAQTVGAIFNLPGASNNLTLISPTNFNKSYLINNCGEIYNEWESDFNAGQIAQLDRDGNLYRAGRVFNATFGILGGSGGVLQKFSWEGDLLWEVIIADEFISQHHDIELLPNGNLLILVWNKLTEAEAIELGKDSTKITSSGMVTEMIWEIMPIGTDDYEIVWKWDSLDHLVQSFDQSLPNYGLPIENPGKIDFNLNDLTPAPVDWLHFNSIDYNEDLDQILISARDINEILILDKSTNTIEASSSEGGNSNRGGELLFRWGNPANYTGSSTQPRELYGQHDASWIENDFPGSGNIIFFNNGTNRPNEQEFSTVDEIAVNFNGVAYEYLGNEDNQALDRVWTFRGETQGSLYSSVMSGASRLSNGNTLITESNSGRIFEVNQNLEILRSYISPVNNNGPIAQDNPAIANTIFKAISYPLSYFESNLVIENTFEKIEIFPLNNCEIFTSTTQPIIEKSLKIHYDNINRSIIMEFENEHPSHMNILNLAGQLVATSDINKMSVDYSTVGLTTGLYYIQFSEGSGYTSQKIFIY